MKRHQFPFDYPSNREPQSNGESQINKEPEWAHLVSRWYQLDKPAFGLCQWAHQVGKSLGPPDIIILASPDGCSETDRQFCLTTSPARFVHTLPSVRASALCQVLGWHGRVLCIQNGIPTLAKAQREASFHRNPWILQVSGQAFWLRCGMIHYWLTKN